MTEIEKKTGMTDAECEYWDEYFTNNPYKPGPNLLELGIKPGFANKALAIRELDREVAEYLSIQAKNLHKSHIQVINDIVHEKMAVGI